MESEIKGRRGNGEQRERGMELTTSGGLLYARHHGCEALCVLCANTLDRHKYLQDEY